MIDVRLDKFTFRDYQLNLAYNFENSLDKHKRFIAIWPRGAGKDLASFNLLIRAAIKRVGVYFLVYPSYSQGRKVLWQTIDNSGNRFLDYCPKELIAKANETEMALTLVNGSRIQVVGSLEVDAIRGTNPVGCIFSEYAFQNPNAYRVISPRLNGNGGWAVFITTPNGHNHGEELFKIAKKYPDTWWSELLTIDDTKHITPEQVQAEIERGEISQDHALQEYYCFRGDAQVMTFTGLKRIDSIEAGDMVITDTGRVRKVKERLNRKYSGDLIEINSYGSSENILCTPEHPINVYSSKNQKYEWKAAKELTLNDRLVFPKIVFGSFPIIKRELCLLLAWYISDGSTFKNGLQFSVNKKKAPRIEELLTSLRIKYSLFYNNEVVLIAIYSTQLVDFFRQHCGLLSYDKKIPFSLISTFQEEFFFELMKGDGCLSINPKSQRYSFSTTSKTLAYQVQILANSLDKDFASGITCRKASTGIFPGGRLCETHEAYNVQIYFAGIKSTNSYLARAKYGIAAKIREIKHTYYEGDVYNLSVQYDESYVVNGRAVHNCSFSAGNAGAYYAKLINDMRIQERITNVPHDPSREVFTAWDLGYNDAMAIVFFQVNGIAVNIIDCYENNKQGFAHYAKIIKAKGAEYNYGKHFAPHDVAKHDVGSGLTLQEVARENGVNFFKLAESGVKGSIRTGIEKVRCMLPRTWIDQTKGAGVIKALENYRQIWNPRLEVYHDEPLHDKYSNMADACRYAALSLPYTERGYTVEDLQKNYQEARYGPPKRSFFENFEKGF